MSYQCVEGGSFKVQYLRKQKTVVTTSGMKDKVRQGILFSGDFIYRNKMFVCLLLPGVELPTSPLVCTLVKIKAD